MTEMRNRSTNKMWTQLDEISRLSLLMAAAMHDVDHPGVSNAYLTETSDLLAVRYNDRSSLENHHLAVGFGIMHRAELLTSLTEDDYKAFRKLTIALVLSTDLANHFTSLGAFRTEISSGGVRIQQIAKGAQDRKKLDESSVQNVLAMMLKCADVGHAAKPREQHMKWTRRITVEFFEQGDKERLAGISVSGLCDRTAIVIPKSQVGFFEYVVLPMYSAWKNFLALSGFDHSAAIAKVKGNYEFWKEEQAMGDKSTHVRAYLELTGDVFPDHRAGHGGAGDMKDRGQTDRRRGVENRRRSFSVEEEEGEEEEGEEGDSSGTDGAVEIVYAGGASDSDSSRLSSRDGGGGQGTSEGRSLGLGVLEVGVDGVGGKINLSSPVRGAKRGSTRAVVREKSQGGVEGLTSTGSFYNPAREHSGPRPPPPSGKAPPRSKSGGAEGNRGRDSRTDSVDRSPGSSPQKAPRGLLKVKRSSSVSGASGMPQMTQQQVASMRKMQLKFSPRKVAAAKKKAAEEPP